MNKQALAEEEALNKLIAAAQLADYMEKTIQTLHNWRKMGLLEEPVKVGNYTFWTVEQVGRLKERREERKR